MRTSRMQPKPGVAAIAASVDGNRLARRRLIRIEEKPYALVFEDCRHSCPVVRDTLSRRPERNQFIQLKGFAMIVPYLSLVITNRLVG